MKTYYRFILLAFILVLAGCSPAAETNAPVNDTSRLDSMARQDTKSAEFAQRVELYYQSLQKKDWPTSYDMRTANFKQDTTKEYYLQQMADEGKKWSLVSYKVLNIDMHGDTNGIYAAQIIMEFKEGGLHSYQCALWERESGTWVCDEPGLSGLGLLHSTRAPYWDKH